MSGTVAHVVGARPNFMKAAPVIRALDRRGVAQTVIHSGQHYDAAMSDVFFRDLGLPEPDRNLGVGSGSHAVQTAAIMVALEGAFLEIRPALAIVYGDVNSTTAAALVAAKIGLPLAHVEAGLRSFDMTMPEEVNRRVTDMLSDLCAGMLGGLGMAPGAYYGSNCAVFEAVHGSAPKYTGLNKVNPTALLLSAVMMLDHLGEDSAAKRITKAVEDVLVEGKSRTYDLGGSAGTSDFADAIVGKL
jgi:hypothetical protein